MSDPFSDNRQVAYNTDSFREKFDIGKTKLHEELNAGRQKARRLGRKIIITHDDAIAWLNSLPAREAPKSGDCE